MSLVAKGEVEIGLTFLSEMNDPGIDVVGALPKSDFDSNHPGGIRFRTRQRFRSS